MTRLGGPARHLIVRDLPRLTFRLNGEALTFWFAMASLTYHVIEADIAIAGPFDSWSAARAWMTKHSSGDRIEGRGDPTVDFASNSEPQEMTASWARRMARAA